MIFTSESGLTDPSRLAEWDVWYLGHLAAMAAVPGIASAQRFGLLGDSLAGPPSLAMYTVAAASVFDSETYRRTRGMGSFVPVVDERLHRRNLFEGLERAPEAAPTDTLVIADRQEAGPAAPGLHWLRAVGLERSTPWRGIAVLRDRAAAEALAAHLGGALLYAPLTGRYPLPPAA